MKTGTAQIQNDRKRQSCLVSVDGRTYPLKSANINARAEGGIAATTLSQTYENPYKEALEVLYTLPLPVDGAVVGYTIRIGKRVIQGEVRRREEAREEYRKALFTGRTAALLEQERADTFTQKLGSLPPGEAATVEIEVLQPLAFLPGTTGEQACWEYRFPTVAGVRYEGGENRVPDAEKLDVDRASEGTPARLEAKLQIADGPAENIRPHSPAQHISVQGDENGATVLIEKGMILDRDLVVRWYAGKQETGLRAIEGKGLSSDNGRYLLITLTPPNEVSDTISRDLTLLIDCSGSMSGRPLEQAKEAAIELLRSLDPGDRFEILTFANKVQPLISGPVDAREKYMDHACKELRKLQASGGTEMTEAIIEALRPLRGDSQRQVILLSDGYIGFEREVIGEIWRRLMPGARVHVVGVGSAPNRTLTQGAARAGRGVEVIIGLEDDVRKAAERLLQATVHPVLTDILIKGSGLVSHAPHKPRDVFAGQPALIFAEVKTDGGRLEICGRTAGNSSEWVQTLEIPPLQHASQGLLERDANTTSIPIGALFGREAIEDAEIDLAACGNGDSTEIKEKIEHLGLRHGISSRMTSLIAISEDPTVDPRNPRRRERLPVEVPAGVSAEGAGLLACAAPGFFAAPRRSKASRAMDTFSTLLMEEERMSGMPPVRPIVPATPIVAERTQVLKLDDQILVFEFEAPMDGFVLPGSDIKIHVLFDDLAEECIARVMKSDSGKPGPHAAGLIVRLALKLEGHRCWHHDVATIHWRDRLKMAGRKTDIDVAVRVRLK